ncbi:PRC-barrel domain-containing protein [Aquabacter spiritensis]|uniref:Sporulation protein YlmC with PRC-barrel domain n=1 Tax=Aquabacter spiritensis TaxID=933073 RepID=A0A4R3LW41_9HYPH|nr:PRC-barrel domain-containing protein [Aquabacter spiritensis]TCT03929.1 sporulation protein YlmC with PRC-barrel domain [Aquabacter spiritensis]
MHNKFLAIAAVTTLFAAPAFAQSTAPSSAPNATPPAATAPGGNTRDMNTQGGANTGANTGANMGANTGANMGARSGTMSTAGGAFIDSQQREQWLASTLIGTKVQGSGEEDLGEVNDVLLDRSGNVVGAVIGVGGFLGIGEKDVAVPFNTLELVRNADGDTLILRKSKDELQNAPAFKEYTDQNTTTGGSASGTMGAPRATTTTPPATTR